jgi:hypothetical protein
VRRGGGGPTRRHVASFDATPLLHQIPQYPPHNFATQPHNILARIVTTGRLPFRICGPAHVNDMHKRIGMSQIVEELISQSTALVCSRYQSRNIQQLDRDRALAVFAGTVVRFTLGLFAVARTCTVLYSPSESRQAKRSDL